MRKLILVSRSPRRRELLKKAGFTLDVRPVETSEVIDSTLPIEKAIEKVAQEKVTAFLDSSTVFGDLKFHCLGADTVVVDDNKILGKPKNDQDAFDTLKQLSGGSHKVITGYSIFSFPENSWKNGSVTTEVFFKSLSDSEINDYIKTGEPFDKAGAYGIQGQAGQFVDKYEGSYDNVVGLPVDQISSILKQIDG